MPFLVNVLNPIERFLKPIHLEYFKLQIKSISNWMIDLRGLHSEHNLINWDQHSTENKAISIFIDVYSYGNQTVSYIVSFDSNSLSFLFQMMWCDMMFYCCMENMYMQNQSMFSNYPKMMALYNRVATHPKICSYLKGRCKSNW